MKALRKELPAQASRSLVKTEASSSDAPPVRDISQSGECQQVQATLEEHGNKIDEIRKDFYEDAKKIQSHLSQLYAMVTEVLNRP